MRVGYGIDSDEKTPLTSCAAPQDSLRGHDLLSACLNKRVEEPLLSRAGVGGQLGVPLHGEKPGMRFELATLDGAVGSAGDWHQSLGRVANGLVMPGGGRKLRFAENTRQSGLGIHHDCVLGRLTRGKAMDHSIS